MMPAGRRDHRAELAARAYFVLCVALGRLLRSGTYSTTPDRRGGRERQVRKSRVVLRAPPGLAGWAAAQDPRYRRAGPPAAGLGGAGAPASTGASAARRFGSRPTGRSSCRASLERRWRRLLEDPELDESVRKTAIERAVVALAEFHRAGFTHGDAMAENVLVDLEPASPTGSTSRRCMIRVARSPGDVPTTCGHCSPRASSGHRPEKRAETLQLILDVYADEGVTRVLAASFTSVLRRPLTFHLAQAGLSLRCFREIGRLLRERCGA